MFGSQKIWCHALLTSHVYPILQASVQFSGFLVIDSGFDLTHPSKYGTLVWMSQSPFWWKFSNFNDLWLESLSLLESTEAYKLLYLTSKKIPVGFWWFSDRLLTYIQLYLFTIPITFQWVSIITAIEPCLRHHLFIFSYFWCFLAILWVAVPGKLYLQVACKLSEASSMDLRLTLDFCLTYEWTNQYYTKWYCVK